MKETSVHTLIIGSGAAGLNGALQLHRKGIEDILILSEGLDKGTSINTGSDKQTYYKQSLCGSIPDSPLSMAEVYFNGGAMHGDLALVEASTSTRAFFNLADLGVPFPTDSYGQYAGYKTDHDPSQRATSIGPYTSREMCKALIKAVNQAGIPILEKRDVIELITIEEKGKKRAAGAIAIGENDKLEVYRAENILFAVGGPGGLYKTSVYPGCHTGAIGLALGEGALAANLPESQFGMASTGFRWNVSGTYMQVIPRFVSVSTEDPGDESEFLKEYFTNPQEMYSKIFLKGYQWPFDSTKVQSGSSIIDILVYIETEERKRKVYLDFTRDPEGFDFNLLSDEAYDYLKKSEAFLDSPIKRLEKMNPGAINLYLDNHIDIRKEKLEIAVCAQHNNGGLAADHWWQSENISHLFPLGEVNGSHGVNRPGGSALNSGQVGGYRAAEFISASYSDKTLNKDLFDNEVSHRLQEIETTMALCSDSPYNWKSDRQEFNNRMSESGAFIRSKTQLQASIIEAEKHLKRIRTKGSAMGTGREKREYFRNRQLCLAHLIYLESILFVLQENVGSRGSSLVLDSSGEKIPLLKGEKWKLKIEDSTFRTRVHQTEYQKDGKIVNQWAERREIPRDELWFEAVWQKYRDKEIYS